jgi:hypothetical protein
MTTEQTGIDAIELRVSNAIDQPNAELICDLLDRFAYMKRRIKELETQFKPVLAAWIKENGPVSIGETQWSYAADKDTDSVDHGETLDALFTYFKGDVDKVAEAFSSHPFKHGWCREALPPEVYDKCFKTVVSDGVKVKSFNKAFVKQKA